MINVIFNDFSYEVLPRQKETWDKYCKIIQWGRANPTRFLEDFVGLQFTDHQKYVILSSWLPANVVWVCSRSSGKAQTLDTPVYCVPKDRGGYDNKYPHKTIGDLKVGDSIIGDDGKPTQVIHLNPIIIEDIYEVEFSDGEIIKCNGEHLWRIYDRNYDKNHENEAIIRNTDFIYSHFDDNFKDGNKEFRFHVPLTEPVKYPGYDRLFIHPYLLGAWLGDGSIFAAAITSAKSDKDEMIRNLSPYCDTIIWKEKKEQPTCGSIFIDRKKELDEKYLSDKRKSPIPLTQKLRKLGVIDNKHIPEKYMFASIEDRLALIQGLMDTDGTVDKNGHCEFTQTNEKIIRQVYSLLCSLGFNPTLSYKEHTKYIKKNGEEANTWRIYFTASKEMPVFRMKRKYDRLPEHPLRNSNQKAIVSVRKTGDKKAMRCITVNNKSGCYLCGNNYTVTHNSFMSAPFIMARSLLIPSHNTYIMGPTGSQAQETFTKMENLAKNNIASVVGVSSVFLDETVRMNAKADPFVHDKNSYHVELYNGSTVNTLNSVAKNIVGIRSNLNENTLTFLEIGSKKYPLNCWKILKLN